MRARPPTGPVLYLGLVAITACSSPPVAATADLGAHDASRAQPDAGPADAAADGPACAAPLAFVPPGTPEGFEKLTTKTLVVTQGAANHRGQDVVVEPGLPQVLIAKFAYGKLDKDLKQELVDVYIQARPPCGPWTLLGSERTSDGKQGTRFGIEDDGGRVFFEVPAATATAAGRYPVRMLVRGDHSMARLTLFVLDPGTEAVVFDIDGTLTTDDFELVSELLIELFAGSYTPKMYADAPAVVQAWVDRGYLPIYLTARPDFLHAISRDWLIDRGFAPGVLHLTDTNTQSLPGNTAAYKAAFLGRVTGPGGAVLRAGYGNATTDIEAYALAGVPKSQTYIIGKQAGAQQTVAVDSYAEHLPALAPLPPASSPAPPATFGW